MRAYEVSCLRLTSTMASCGPFSKAKLLASAIVAVGPTTCIPICSSVDFRDSATCQMSSTTKTATPFRMPTLGPSGTAAMHVAPKRLHRAEALGRQAWAEAFVVDCQHRPHHWFAGAHMREVT